MLQKYAKRGTLILYYGAAAWLAFGTMAYGLAWRSYPKTHLVNLHAGGGVFAGDVEKLESSGFFGRRDYVITLRGRPERILIPFTLLMPPWEDAGRKINFSREVKEGDHLYIRTTGGPQIVLELINRPAGKPQVEVMNYSVSQTRFNSTLTNAKDIGNRYLLIGAFILGAAGALHLAWIARRRRPATPSQA